MSKDVDLGGGPYRPNWLAYIIGLGTLFFGTILSAALYFWNPKVRQLSDPFASGRDWVGRGGWLVLLAIGLFIRPFYRFYSLGEGFDNLDLDIWNAVTTEGDESYHLLWGPAILGGVMWDLFLLPLELLQIVLYIQLRTSLPKLLIVEFIILLAEGVIFGVVYQILPGVDEGAKAEWFAVFVSGLLAAMIWIPYLLVSRRVRNTFVVRRGAGVVPPPLPPQDSI